VRVSLDIPDVAPLLDQLLDHAHHGRFLYGDYFIFVFSRTI
jgi:hypothetical protein